MCIYLGLFLFFVWRSLRLLGITFWFWSSWTRWLCFRFGSRWLHRWFLCLGWLICISSFLCSSCVIVTWLMLWCFSWIIRTRRLTWLSVFIWFICFFLRCFFLSWCVFFLLSLWVFFLLSTLNLICIRLFCRCFFRRLLRLCCFTLISRLYFYWIILLIRIVISYIWIFYVI